MQGVKAETEAWAAKNGVADKAFAFSFAFTGWALVGTMSSTRATSAWCRSRLADFCSPSPAPHQAEVTQEEAVQNIGLALLAVFVVSAVLLAHVGMAVVLVLMIASVLVCILGLMTFWDVPLEAVAVTQLVTHTASRCLWAALLTTCTRYFLLHCSHQVLSVGLAVDYSLHIAHSFLHKSGTRNERATLAVVEMGISVLNGTSCAGAPRLLLTARSPVDNLVSPVHPLPLCFRRHFHLFGHCSAGLLQLLHLCHLFQDVLPLLRPGRCPWPPPPACPPQHLWPPGV